MSASTPRPRSARRVAATFSAITAMVIAPAFFQAATAKPDPIHPGNKGKPAQTAAPKPAGPDCDVTLGDGPKDEFANCADVALTAATTPDLGVTTTIDIAVTSVKDLHAATLTLGVNDGFDIAGSSGFSDAGTQASGVGSLTAVSRSIDVTAGQIEHFSIDVTGVKAGTGVVKATLDAGGRKYNGGDELDVHLGTLAPTPPNGLATAKVPAGTNIAAPHEGSNLKPPTKGMKKPSAQVDPGTPGADCATGGWFFGDETGATQPAFDFVIQVWDQDSVGGDDLLASGFAGGDGRYNLCFESTDGDGGGQEVYIKFVSSNGAYRVRDTAGSNSDYIWSTGVFNYADPGGSHEFGNLEPADSTLFRAIHAYVSITLLYQWYGGYLDNPGEFRQLIVNWTNTSTDGTYYSLGSNDVHLAAADPDADHTTIHEGSHALMDALYDDDFPPAPSCNPHSIFGPSSTGCAWTEGFAEWAPARVLDDPFFRWPDGNSLDLENEGWTTFTGAYGDTAEGRIAGALIDLSDSNNEAPWDRYTEGGSGAGSEEVMATLKAKEVSDTFSEYFNVDRPGEGDTGYLARAAVFQNTIDYTNRDPLTSQQELTRPSLAQAPNPHNYSYTATAPFWGGVAIRPPGGGDYDLHLYGDEAQTNLLGSSAFGGSTIDYVLVDGNHRTGSFFPRALLFAGSGSYDIEEFTGNQTIGLGSASNSFGAGDIIQPLDALVAGGETQYVGVQPSGGLDVSVFAHVSDSANLATTVQGRPSAVAGSNSTGLGGAEYITYSAPTTDWTGLVVLREAGSGGYTVYRDNAVPSGASVVVDGGNTQTYDTTVDLTLSATAANTPVAEMQISTDGTFDTEPWVAYNTSATATLPAGNGSKTVSVRYRSAAGAISATATDDITLVPVPTCNGLTATAFGNGTVTGTPGNDVIVGGPGADAISGQGGNDTICGLGGNDSINDGAGADHVFGGNGNDVINQPAAVDNGDVFDGGAGTDQVSYAPRTGDVSVTLDANANDGVAGEGDFVMTTVENVTTGAGNDTIVGSSSPNRLIGNGGNDTISGAAGNDYLAGVGGNDTLRGVDGTDTILGGDGDDTVDEGNAANGTDTIKGGAGFNKITYAARTTAVTISLTGAPNSGAAGENDKVIAFQWAIGGSGSDTINGHTTNDTLTGNGGDDHLNGNGGNDTMTGNAGADVLNGGNGNDALDTVDGVSGNDTANGAAGTDTATTDPGDIKISIP